MMKAQLIVAADGRVQAAALATEADRGDGPQARLVPGAGERLVMVDLPAEVARLGGPDLQRYFSDLRIDWPAEVTLPEISIRKRPDAPAAD